MPLLLFVSNLLLVVVLVVMMRMLMLPWVLLLLLLLLMMMRMLMLPWVLLLLLLLLLPLPPRLRWWRCLEHPLGTCTTPVVEGVCVRHHLVHYPTIPMHTRMPR